MQEQSAAQSQPPRNRHERRAVARDVEPERLLYSVKSSMRALDVGRTTIWRMVKAGQLESVKIGARTYLTAESVKRAASEGATTAAAE